jgi:hypothetical protein
LADSINLDEWLAELTRLQESPSDAWTVQEMAAQTGKSVKSVRDKLRLGIAAGTVQITRKHTTTLDGRSSLVPAYRIKQNVETGPSRRGDSSRAERRKGKS